MRKNNNYTKPTNPCLECDCENCIVSNPCAYCKAPELYQKELDLWEKRIEKYIK